VYGPAALSSALDYFRLSNTDPTRLEVEFVPVRCTEPKLIYSSKSVCVQAFPLNHRIETYGYLFRETEPKLNVEKFRIGQYGLGVEEICRLKDGEDLVRFDSEGNEILRVPNAELTYRPYRARSFAYCSDTAPFPELPQWVRGVDLLYHEATYEAALEKEARERYHSTTLEAADCALKAGAGRLVCAHYSSRYIKTESLLKELRSVFPNSFTADDGDVYDIPLDSFKAR
ncbi:MAG: MBL fold metallo-hydrolase, partial [Candidatus Cryptobacteroides sp.]